VRKAPQDTAIGHAALGCEAAHDALRDGLVKVLTGATAKTRARQAGALTAAPDPTELSLKARGEQLWAGLLDEQAAELEPLFGGGGHERESTVGLEATALAAAPEVFQRIREAVAARSRMHAAHGLEAAALPVLHRRDEPLASLL